MRGTGLGGGRLVMWDVQRHQQDAVEPELLPGLPGEREMAQVGRVEGTPEDPEGFRGGIKRGRARRLR